MELHLSYEQRARLELLAIQAGCSTSRLVMDAIELVLDRDAADAPAPEDPATQRFLSEPQLEYRFSRLLRY